MYKEVLKLKFLIVIIVIEWSDKRVGIPKLIKLYYGENSDELLIFMNIVIEEQDYCQGVVFFFLLI